MTAVTRSLADSLRRFGDDRLEALLVARPDLTSPLPRGIGPLAARAAGSTSARRALEALTLPELHLVEALAVLEDGASPAQLAAAVSSAPATIAAGLERLITLALVWGEDELHLIRPLRDGLRTPAGLAAPSPEDPSEREARQRVERARDTLPEVLETLAWGPSAVAGSGRLASDLLAAGIVVADGESLAIPRTVQLALRDGRVRRTHVALRPSPDGPELAERIPGSRAAQAVERAFEALRLLGTVRGFDEDPPGVLRRGGLPQRDLRRLAERAGAPLLTYATVLQSAWQAGLIGHDGEEWHPTAE
ncbi:MAG: helicase-associated domain-containing protein, partial [Brachybacterium sp.]